MSSVEQIQFELLDILTNESDEIPTSEARKRVSQRLGLDIKHVEFIEAQQNLIDKHKVSRSRQGMRASLAKYEGSRDIGARNILERDLERYVENFLHLHFVPDIIDPLPRSVGYIVQNTARGGQAGGLWTRPDITLATVTRYRFQPVPELELYGFELKNADGCSVYAVHEALAHTSFVHYSTLAFFLPENHPSERNLPRMKEQALEHGIGLIRLWDHEHLGRYELIVEAKKKNPAMWALNQFVESRFDDQNKNKLVEWLRLCQQE